MKRHGFSSAEFSVMELLYHKGRMPLLQIGETMLVTSGSVTYTVDKLEGKGYIRRVECAEDRRVTYAEMTEAGKIRFGRVFPAHAAYVRSLMNGLTLGEQQEAVELLKKLGHHVKYL